MKQAPVAKRGKRTREQERGMKEAAPVVCERAGGTWCGWTGERCVNVQCEMVEGGVRCNNYGWWYPLAHIQGRGAGGREQPENLVNLCLEHHTRMDNGAAEERDTLRETAKRIAVEGR